MHTRAQHTQHTLTGTHELLRLPSHAPSGAKHGGLIVLWPVQMEFVDTRTGELYMDGYPQEIMDMGEEAFHAAIAG